MRRRLLSLVIALSLVGSGALIQLRDGSPHVPARDTPRNPLDRFVRSDHAPRTFEGHVAERLRAGPYTYLRVRTDAGAEHWVASLAHGLTSSETVSVKVIADAPTFESRRLSRVFSTLIFGVVRDAAHPEST